MSLQANPKAKTKLLPSAVFLALVGTSTTGYAVNFGATSYQSTQHEPLSASIPVSDIDANNFNVSLANSTIYQQMGLTPNSSIRASFQRTSANSGRIIIKSSQPINDPFADIVLDIKSNDKKQFMPKTLLMPIGKNGQVKTAPVVASSNNVNLPKVNQQATSPKPQEPKLPVVAQAQTITQVQPTRASKGIPDGEFAEATRQAFIADQAASKKLEETKQSQGPSQAVTAKQNQNKKPTVTEPKVPVTASTNTKQPSKPQTTATQQVTAAAKPKVNTAPTQEPAIGKVPSDRILLQDKSSLQAENSKNPATKSTPDKKPQTAQTASKPKPAAQRASGKSTYVVQRNDNLWTIANEIAKRNKANVHTVMKQIQSNNPNAFVNGNASRLITNKTLILPDYQTIPSQKSLEEAIAARRAAISKRNASNAKGNSNRSGSRSNQQAKTTRNSQSSKPRASNNSTAKAKPSSSRSTSKYTAPPKPATKASSKPKPRVSLVAPGSSSKSNSTRATGSSNNSKLVTTLRSSRQTTARHASRVRQLNTQVSSYTQQLQLQNKKLAELEARLKQLRGK